MDDATTARIVEVTLFPDRAVVLRRAEVPHTGRVRLVIGPVSPLLSPEALRYGATAPIVVEEAHVERRVVASAAAPAAAEERERSQAAIEAHRRAAERVGRSEVALEAARAAAARGLVEAGEPGGRWVEVIGQLASAHVGLLQEEARLRRAAQAQPLPEPAPAEESVQRWLVLSVYAEAPGALDISYQVPCAAWRPAHRAQLAGEAVRWERYGACWNATGEDWDGVTLRCVSSDANADRLPRRPAPVLVDDVLAVRTRPPADEDAYGGLIRVAREAAPAVADGALAADDGGQPVTLTGSASIPADGRPVFVPFGALELGARVDWVAWPERAPYAVLRAALVNAWPEALLAGPVEVFRGDEYVGRTQIGLVAPGEPFTLGFGAHPGLHLTRRRVDHADRPSLSGPQHHTIAVEVRVAHVGAEPCEVEVRERLPTSALPEITVAARGRSTNGTGGEAAGGSYRWRLKLEPGETRTLGLDVVIEAAGHVRLPY